MAARKNTTKVESAAVETEVYTVETLKEYVKVGSLRTLTATDWKGSIVQVEDGEVYQNRTYALVTLLTDTRGKLRKPELQRTVKVRPESLGNVLKETLDQLTADMVTQLEGEKKDETVASE